MGLRVNHSGILPNLLRRDGRGSHHGRPDCHSLMRPVVRPLHSLLLRRRRVREGHGPVLGCAQGLDVRRTTGQRRRGAARQGQHRGLAAEDRVLATHVITVLGLVPVGTLALVEQLGETLVGRHRGEDPPQRRQEQRKDQAVLLLLRADRQVREALVLLLTQGREEHLIHQHRTAAQPHEHGRVVQHRREQRLDEERDALPAAEPRGDVQHRRRPHDRVDQERQRRAPDVQVVRQVPHHAHFAHRPERPARLDQERDQEALEPATPLVLGLLQTARRLLEGDAVEHLDGVAQLREAHRQVDVLGHVVDIPHVRDRDPATLVTELQRTVRLIDRPEGVDVEVVAGAAERRDQAQADQTGQQPTEVDHVLGPVERVDAATARVPELEHPLHAGDGLVPDRPVVERRDRLEELKHLGAVLEVPDDQALPLDELHGVVARHGLVAGGALDGFDRDQLHVRQQLVLPHDVQRGLVVIVDDEQDLELTHRVGNPQDRVHQPLETVGGLTPHGDEHAVHGQLGVVDSQIARSRESVTGAHEGHEQLEADEDQVEHRDHRDHNPGQCRRTRQNSVERGGQDEHQTEHFLTRRQEDLSGLLLAPGGVRIQSHVGHPFL